MPVRFKIRAHTSVSGSDRWAWVEDYISTPLGPCICWTLEEGQAGVSEGLDDPQGRHVTNPSPEQMAEFLRQFRRDFEHPSEVWGLELVYLDGGAP